MLTRGGAYLFSGALAGDLIEQELTKEGGLLLNESKSFMQMFCCSPSLFLTLKTRC